MSLFAIDKANFDFNKFVIKTMKFIKKSFGSDTSVETLRYFNSFSINIEENNHFELKEIKKKISSLKKLQEKRKISKSELSKRIIKLKEIESLLIMQRDEVDNNKTKSILSKASEVWNLKDFKNAILKNNETIFFPFSSGLEAGGMISTAVGKRILIGNENEMQVKRKSSDIFAPFSHDRNPGISMTDCFGFLVKKVGNLFIFIPSIAWGGMTSSVEPTDHSGIAIRMHPFLKSFMKVEEGGFWGRPLEGACQVGGIIF